MTKDSRRMVEYGFVKSESDKIRFRTSKPEEWKKYVASKKEKDWEAMADHDELEIVKDQILLTPYPKSAKKYYLIYETPHESIEPIYYWILGHLTYDWGFSEVIKITDIFTASEHSAFYGAAAQRLGLAQDKVSQFLAAIGQFIRKDLFQLVRDLKWIDERLKYHRDARGIDEKGEKTARGRIESAEVTLKGIWTDLVDGVVQGQRVSANVFQMAQQLQFTTLPDFFFALNPQTPEEVDGMVERLDTTKPVKSVLKRKLYQYMEWREANFKELQTRKNFELRYLRQHYNIIRMYMNWVKPYARHISRLRADVSKLSAPELVAAFEGSMVEIEILAKKAVEGNDKAFSCVVVHFDYTTRPSMSFAQEGGYHRGPVHIGEVKITWRAYGWTQEQIENYQRMREKEDLELLAEIDSSIKATMDAIKEDLEKYLKEAGELFEEKKEKEEKPKAPGFAEPFTAIGAGFKELFTSIIPKPSASKKTEKTAKEALEIEQAKCADAAKDAKKMAWQCYKNFKKAHGMLTW